MNIFGIQFSGMLALVSLLGVGGVVAAVMLVRRFAPRIAYFITNARASPITLPGQRKAPIGQKQIEFRARRNALYDVKERVGRHFEMEPPPAVFLDYANTSWDLVDELEEAFHIHAESVKDLETSHNKAIEDISMLRGEIAQLRKLQQGQVAKFKSKGRKR